MTTVESTQREVVGNTPEGEQIFRTAYNIGDLRTRWLEGGICVLRLFSETHEYTPHFFGLCTDRIVSEVRNRCDSSDINTGYYPHKLVELNMLANGKIEGGYSQFITLTIYAGDLTLEMVLWAAALIRDARANPEILISTY